MMTIKESFRLLLFFLEMTENEIFREQEKQQEFGGTNRAKWKKYEKTGYISGILGLTIFIDNIISLSQVKGLSLSLLRIFFFFPPDRLDHG